MWGVFRHSICFGVLVVTGFDFSCSFLADALCALSQEQYDQNETAASQPTGTKMSGRASDLLLKRKGTLGESIMHGKPRADLG